MCVIRTLEKSAIICLRQYDFAMKILRVFCNDRHSNFRHLVTKRPYWLQHEYVLPLHEVVASCLRNRDSHQLEARGLSQESFGDENGIDLAVEGNRIRNEVDTLRRITNWFIHTSKHCNSSLLITSVAFRKLFF